MNFIVDSSKIDWNHLFITEKKKNIVIDGHFSKLIYSDESSIINGIFIHVGFLENKYEDTEDIGVAQYAMRNSKHTLSQFQKETFYLDNTLAINKKQIEKIIQLEENILNYYGFFLQHGIGDNKKIANYGLRTQLMSGIIKVHTTEINNDVANEIMQYDKNDSIHHFVLKISGIWETNQTYGITYKFLFTY